MKWTSRDSKTLKNWIRWEKISQKPVIRMHSKFRSITMIQLSPNTKLIQPKEFSRDYDRTLWASISILEAIRKPLLLCCQTLLMEWPKWALDHHSINKILLSYSSYIDHDFLFSLMNCCTSSTPFSHSTYLSNITLTLSFSSTFGATQVI